MKKVDQNLLFICAENSRIKLRDASTILKKSPQRLKYSMDSLQKENILALPHALIDYSYFGLLLFKVYYKGGYLGEDEKKAFYDKLSSNGFIVSCYSLEGEFDFALEVLASNPSRFNKEIRAINSSLKSLPDSKVILNVVSHLYSRAALPKNYLLIDQFQREYVVGGDRPVKSFSEDELKVLKLIWEDPQKPMTFYSTSSGMHINTFKKILSSLQEQKILRGFRHVVNLDDLGMERVRLLISLHSITEAEKDQMLEFFQSKKQIVQASWTVGDWNLEIDLETKDRVQLRKLMIEIRQQFKTMIRQVQTVDIIDFYRRQYLPKFLFEGVSQK